MRTILALATAVLLFAPGCGDTTTNPDMPISVVDMAASTGSDMTQTCQTILNCAKNCLSKPDIQGCATTCAANAPATAKQQFGALEQCLFQFCVLDATAQQIGVCVGAALTDSAKCMSQAAACM
jgi:hypothetical protein